MNCHNFHKWKYFLSYEEEFRRCELCFLLQKYTKYNGWFFQKYLSENEFIIWKMKENI